MNVWNVVSDTKGLSDQRDELNHEVQGEIA